MKWILCVGVCLLAAAVVVMVVICRTAPGPPRASNQPTDLLYEGRIMSYEVAAAGSGYCVTYYLDGGRPFVMSVSEPPEPVCPRKPPAGIEGCPVGKFVYSDGRGGMFILPEPPGGSIKLHPVEWK